jgi:hypothetical protein
LRRDRYIDPLNDILDRDSKDFGRYMSIKYWISDEKFPQSELDEKFGMLIIM